MDEAEDPWFAQCPDRRGTGSEKWDRWAGRDVIPAWVADMDVQSPRDVIEALQTRVAHGVFGYGYPPAALAEAVAAHLQTRHDFRIDPSHVVVIPGMVVGLNLAARAIGDPGDEIQVLTPIYPPFLSVPATHGRRMISVPLVEQATGWVGDWDALERATTPRTRALWLCSPHNPTGRVFSRAELERFAEHCARHDLVLLSDEAHADLVLESAIRHIPTAALGSTVAQRSITLLAPSKTWNLPGLGCAMAIIPDDRLRQRFIAAGAGLVPQVTVTGWTAALAAYRSGGAWLDRLCRHLHGNRDLVAAALAGRSMLRWHPPQATSLAWIDVRGSGIADPAAHLEAHGLGVCDGRDFAGPGWIRLNFGCPRYRLREILVRLARAFPA